MPIPKSLRLCPSFFLLLWVLTSCQSQSSFNFGAYSEAEKHYEKGEYQQAIEKYQAYVRENPEGNMAVISKYYTARSYEALGEKSKARELYQKMVKEQPKLIWADFAKGRLKELGSD